MKDEKIDILKLEYTRACDKMIYLNEQSKKYIGYMLTALGLLVTLFSFLIDTTTSLNERDTSFFLFFNAGALLIDMLMLMSLYHTVECYRFGGYIRFLEEEINSILHRNILSWESKIAPNCIHNSISTVLMYTLLGLVFSALLILVCHVTLFFIFPEWPVIAIGILLIGILEFIAAGILIYKIFTAPKSVYKLLKNDHKILDNRKQTVAIRKTEK